MHKIAIQRPRMLMKFILFLEQYQSIILVVFVVSLEEIISGVCTIKSD